MPTPTTHARCGGDPPCLERANHLFSGRRARNTLHLCPVPHVLGNEYIYTVHTVRSRCLCMYVYVLGSRLVGSDIHTMYLILGRLEQNCIRPKCPEEPELFNHGCGPHQARRHLGHCNRALKPTLAPWHDGTSNPRAWKHLRRSFQWRPMEMSIAAATDTTLRRAWLTAPRSLQALADGARTRFLKSTVCVTTPAGEAQSRANRDVVRPPPARVLGWAVTTWHGRYFRSELPSDWS